MEKYDDYVSKAHRDKVMRELLQKIITLKTDTKIPDTENRCRGIAVYYSPGSPRK